MSRGTLPKNKKDIKENDVRVSEPEVKEVNSINMDYFGKDNLEKVSPKEEKTPVIEQPIAPKKKEENQPKTYISVLLDATLSMAEIYPAVHKKLCMDIETVFRKYKNICWRVVLMYENTLPESENNKLMKEHKLLVLTEGEESAKSLQEKLLDFEFVGGSKDGYETNILPALKEESKYIDGINKGKDDEVIMIFITDSLPPTKDEEDTLILSENIDSAYLYFYEVYKERVNGKQCKVKKIESYIKSQQCDF